VVVERDRIDEVVERAEAILRAEAEARALSEEGMTAAEMLEKFGHV
jgi:regulator of RNase E activity RraA